MLGQTDEASEGWWHGSWGSWSKHKCPLFGDCIRPLGGSMIDGPNLTWSLAVAIGERH